MQQTHGLLVLDADPNDTVAYMQTVLKYWILLPFADRYTGTTMEFSATGLTVKEFDANGRLIVRRFQFGTGRPHEWVEGDE
jgi:hypothetical protein